MSRSLLGLLARRHAPRVTVAERRAFLQASLATASTYLLSCGSTPKKREPSRDGKRVLVIGAGFSGLACAYELLAAGIDVHVLEACGRVGGRVFSFRDSAANAFVPGRVVEGGGELIGSNHPTWVSYAERFDLHWLDVTENEGEVVYPIVLDGKILDFEASEEVWSNLDEGLARLNALASSVDSQEPWNSQNAARLDATSLGEWIASLDLPERDRRILALALTSDNGVEVERQSLLGQLTSIKGGGLERYWSESEVYRCRGGNDLLAHALLRAVGPERVHLQRSVREVRRTNHGVEVLTACDEVHEADEVVLAIPPTVWDSIRFEPGLPAMLRPQMGLNTKNLARVRSRFWEENTPRRSQYALANGVFHQTWDGTDAQGTPPEGAEACLVGFAGGSSVEATMELTREERERQFIELYEHCFPGFTAALVEQRYMDWPRNPFVKAGYSFPAPGQVTTLGPLLQRTHLDGALHIAGEHACYAFVGYMEGALQSGARVARRIAQDVGLHV